MLEKTTEKYWLGRDGEKHAKLQNVTVFFRIKTDTGKGITMPLDFGE